MGHGHGGSHGGKNYLLSGSFFCPVRLQRGSVPVFVLCAIFFVSYLTIFYLLQTAGYLFVAGVAPVAYFMALGRPTRSRKNISLGRVCVCV